MHRRAKGDGVLKLIRIPVLLVLLLAAGPLLKQYSLLRMRLNPEGMIASMGPWSLLIVLAAAFVLLTLAGRDRHHPSWLLILETVIAAVIVLVPPLIWLEVLGRGIVTDALGASTGSVYAQVLSILWLVVAIRTGIDQRRRMSGAGGTASS